MDLTPGRKLPNGATLIMGRKLTDKPGNEAAAIVMAYNKEAHEFVTWMFVDSVNGSYCTHGWYVEDVEDAIGDFLYRVERLEQWTTRKAPRPPASQIHSTQEDVRARRRASTA